MHKKLISMAILLPVLSVQAKKIEIRDVLLGSAGVVSVIGVALGAKSLYDVNDLRDVQVNQLEQDLNTLREHLANIDTQLENKQASQDLSQAHLDEKLDGLNKQVVHVNGVLNAHRAIQCDQKWRFQTLKNRVEALGNQTRHLRNRVNDLRGDLVGLQDKTSIAAESVSDRFSENAVQAKRVQESVDKLNADVEQIVKWVDASTASDFDNHYITSLNGKMPAYPLTEKNLNLDEEKLAALPDSKAERQQEVAGIASTSSDLSEYVVVETPKPQLE